MKLRGALLLVLAFASPSRADLQESVYACVRLPNQGGSATFIETGNGYSLLLTAAHCINGKPIVLDAPAPFGSKGEIRANPRVVKIERQQDLALIRIDYGPVSYVAPIAQALNEKRVYSCGYDEMATPMSFVATSVIGKDARLTRTSSSPWHGRSGGCLLDSSGRLVGVCSGYTMDQQRQGLYVSLESIREFLGGNNGRQFRRGDDRGNLQQYPMQAPRGIQPFSGQRFQVPCPEGH